MAYSADSAYLVSGALRDRISPATSALIWLRDEAFSLTHVSLRGTYSEFGSYGTVMGTLEWDYRPAGESARAAARRVFWSIFVAASWDLSTDRPSLRPMRRAPLSAQYSAHHKACVCVALNDSSA